MKTKLLSLGFLSFSFLLNFSTQANEQDPFLWLEEIQGEASLNWVRSQNEKTLADLTSHPEYKNFENEYRDILTAKDRIPMVFQLGDELYQLWQDETHIQGILRKTSLVQLRRTSPRWKTVLDLDALSKTENKRWVYKGLDCLAPAYRKCLLSLSDGGKDAVVIREFDLKTQTFIAEGFVTEEAKTDTAWINEDEILIGSNFGEGSVTDSGYPRILKIWKRGQPLASAKTVFEVKHEDIAAWPSSTHTEGRTLVYAARAIDFYHQEYFVLNSRKQFKKLNLPTDVSLHGILGNTLFVSRRQEWKLPGLRKAPTGSLLSLSLNSHQEINFSTAQLVWESSDRKSFSEFSVTKNHGLLLINDEVKSKLFALKKVDGRWRLKTLRFPENGSISFVSTSDLSDDFYVSYMDFLTPPSLYRIDLEGTGPTQELLKSKTAVFDSQDLVAEQHFVKSKDGVEVPYFIIRKSKIAFDGKNPTILYGYGGFMVSETPYYLGATGKTWVERGGVYAIANIRGGGEFGPAWHQAALKEKRQTAFNDFYAVAEDLINKGVTSPRHLGISGGSNGGLLVGVAATQRPELFNAVSCAVPLLDMLRYHKLLAGASWMGEYGNPDVAEERAYIEKYSPYQNVFPEKAYPQIFFTGSTADDRVHPGHARKMAAKLESLGYPIYFYENMEGGHGGAANLEQKIKVEALKRVYFWTKLGR